MNNFVLAALMYGIGIWLAIRYHLPWQAGVGVFVLSVCMGGLLWQKGRAALPMACCFLCGAAALGMVTGSRAETPEQRLKEFVGKNVTLTGRTIPGSVRKDSYGGVSFLLQLPEGQVRVHIKKYKGQEMGLGLLQVRGHFSGPDGFYNPGQPDPHVSAAVRGQGGRLQGEGRAVTVLSRELNIREKLQTWGDKLRHQWQKALPPKEAALLSGMVLGGSENIDGDILHMFQLCGLSHLLAVSGSHMAILLGLLWGLAGLLPGPKPLKTVCILICIGCYTVLCGLRPSVCRAFLMGAGALLGKAGRKKADSQAFLGLAAILLLAWRPYSLWDPGFLLSFGACLGLLLLRQPLADRLALILPGSLAGAAAVPLSAQTLTLPILAHFFHMVSLVALAANVLLVPLLSLCLALGGLGAVLGVLDLDLASRVFLICTSQLLGVAFWGGRLLSRLPGTHWVLGQPSAFLFPVYYLGLAGWLKVGWFQMASGKLVRYTRLGCVLALAVLWVFPRLQTQPLTAYFLDVGQGDCAVVVTPEREVLVMDMGGLSGQYDTGERILVPFLRYLGVDKVDMAFVSHGHHDHAGGLAGLLKWYPVKNLYLPNEPLSLDLQKAVHVGRTFQTIQFVYKIQKTRNLPLKSGIIHVVEAPESGKKGGSENENSAVVQLIHPEGSILFTGDAPEALEQKAAKNPIRSDVLKISHHGSNTSSNRAFLAAVQPRLAVISVGRDNRFGHPHEETLKRLKSFNIPVVRTDLQGAIKITFDERGIWWYSIRDTNNTNT